MPKTSKKAPKARRTLKDLPAKVKDVKKREAAQVMGGKRSITYT